MISHSLSRLSLVATLTLLLAGLWLGCAPDTARGQRVAFGSRASTLGIGGDVTVRLTDQFNVRAGGSYFSFLHSGKLKDEVAVQYDVSARLAAVQFLVDWHPLSKAFRLSAGVIYNGTRMEARAHPTEGYTVQQKTFGPERLGSLDAEVSLKNKINPYLGIGFGNAVRGSNVDVYADLGVMYVAQPDVQMSGTGLIAATSNHESTLNQGLRSFNLFPYVALGLSIHF